MDTHTTWLLLLCSKATLCYQLCKNRAGTFKYSPFAVSGLLSFVSRGSPRDTAEGTGLLPCCLGLPLALILWSPGTHVGPIQGCSLPSGFSGAHVDGISSSFSAVPKNAFPMCPGSWLPSLPLPALESSALCCSASEDQPWSAAFPTIQGPTTTSLTVWAVPQPW